MAVSGSSAVDGFLTIKKISFKLKFLFLNSRIALPISNMSLPLKSFFLNIQF